MSRAINDSGLILHDIELVNAHGTSTVLNDFHEAMAINSVFKEHANQVIVTANKSLHGHLNAASGALEVLNTAISLNENFIPGTINVEDQDSTCRINLQKKTTCSTVRTMLKNSFGMGGVAASLVLRKNVH